MGGLLVQHSLGLAQLQDQGRFGVRHLGVTQGGALDWIAAGWANRLLGNSPDCAVIEIPLGGLILEARQDTTLALTGADLDVLLDDQAIPPWHSFKVRSGQRLHFNPPRLGVRAYLAAPGGFQAPQVLGSRSCVLREQLGGLYGDGKALQKGDLLQFSSHQPQPASMAPEQIPDYRQPAHLDLVLGAQYSLFAGRSLFDAFNQPWQVDQRNDRMGLRLLGPALRYRGPGIISEGIPLGAIQVPADGQPIILLNDRQTVGGYPRLGALTPVAVARLAQVAAGGWLRLQPISQAQARVQYLRHAV
ncbi:MAG: biotin-dependent carboxyltransferase family protein [Pseudomonas sp.]